MSPQIKHISDGLKEYQKHILKPKIYISTTTISIHKSSDQISVLTEGISKKTF